ncbi:MULTISPECIES: SMP-30/gluconolactonase/LRE family protein [unclassified Crossiella]|uniref:SMP-30/gluconolactonase/LRE family protein n=1 Tax=unclassified Crossiella TaxID=2620835 RepID=UPI001FFFFBBE|nr:MULTISPECIES: SMP-30/gluconolactonase/LRE family protein [unclassified Crossiella]MCK2237380.1 SMP-30/gluconolactonase/LRE family protein [Crossiella sp. S99.2]MCK2251035.1 SMP-30/gluconolactonase/LRE family protein [Crossiella sp. S99.1]
MRRPAALALATTLLLTATATAVSAAPEAPASPPAQTNLAPNEAPAAPHAPASLPAPASLAALDAPTAPVTWPIGPRPESAVQAWQGRVYVSVQGEATPGRDDGEIRTLDPATGQVSTFATGLDNPRGLAFTGKFLIATDFTRVWQIDRTGAKRVLAESTAFPHPVAALNDAVAEPGGQAVYVTEMGAREKMRDPSGTLWPVDSPQALDIPARARVYRISLSGKVTEAAAPSRRTLIHNGIALGNRPGTLLAAEFFYGNLTEIDLRTGRQSILATGFRAADGIEQATDGTVYVSSYDQGAVWRVDRAGEHPKLLLAGLGSGGTADFLLDERGKRLLIPDTTRGTVTVLPLS